MKHFYFLVFVVSLASCNKSKSKEHSEVTDSTVLKYTIITVLQHNENAFTEGLVIHNNKILESTGNNGHSWIAEVDPVSGEHLKKVNLSQNYFGEGITVLNNRIYHLTYTSRIGFVYDADTYKNIKNFNYDPIIKEGWGLTNNNEHLILSDGTDRLYFLDVANLSKVSKSIGVKYGNDRVQNLNELEYINGYIFANVYETNWILKIDPGTGNVVGRLDLTSLCSEIRSIYPKAEALNGIAYDAKSKALLITGKYWPKAYLIRVK